VDRAHRQPVARSAAVAAKPAVDVTRSVYPDHVVCLECGKQMTMLKRHLMTEHNLTVDEYRAKWTLPSNYPLVAPNYADTRSARNYRG
jgi:predicted transcriptional regulator